MQPEKPEERKIDVTIVCDQVIRLIHVMLPLQGAKHHISNCGEGGTNGEERLDKHGVDHTLMISTQNNTRLQNATEFVQD